MSTTHPARQATATLLTSPSDQDVSDAYLYLLGRLIVLRQEHLDFKNGAFRWNEVIHREPGWPSLGPDVAGSEAWIAVDEDNCTLLEVPEIAGRYYTIQVLNLWGETLVNINERNYPAHPAGSFAFCLRDARVPIPLGTKRINLAGRKARLLMRVELGGDRHEAIALQHRMTLRTTGTPLINPPVEIPLFNNQRLPGVEAFDNAPAILAAEPDINPGADLVRRKVRTVAAAAAAAGRAGRDRIDRIIREQSWWILHQKKVALGVAGNGWVHTRIGGSYGDDWLGRTAVNLTGLWSNDLSEVVSFGNGVATRLDGSETYTATFPADALPSSHVKYFWSVSCVDHASRAIPDGHARCVLHPRSNLQYGADGSLRLYFAPAKPVEAPYWNWLPTPSGQDYALSWRSYGPDHATVSGRWFPAPLEKP